MNEHDVAVLYRAYGYAVFRRCLAYLADVDAALTVVRQTFVHALRNLGEFQAFADPQVWLYRAADERCLRVLDAYARNGVARPELSLRQLRACVANDDHERLIQLLPLLRTLKPKDMRFAVLFYLDELTEEELSRELGLSRRVVARRIAQLVRSAPVEALEASPW
ncbi:MAG TPA: sigma-70 family RNA polymerase sigma factor [Polyangiales bacterium]|nr:sigma-70 family RNA polymerase sigma factor [Polyangiales bacterium]